MPTVLYERLESTALITLNRPEALNAMNAELSQDLYAAWERFMAEDEALVAVLTGAGRAFCAGADMKEAAEAARTGQAPRFRGMFPASAITKPAIAAVNGACAGGGVGFALACDIILCSENAQFVLPFVARGRGGAPIALELARRTSFNFALYAALTAARIDAATALRVGLVHEVLPPDDLLPRAMELAEKIAGHSQLSVRSMKGNLRNAMEVGFAEALRAAAEGDRELHRSADTREGTLAFDEKRRPRYGADQQP
jgi:enoyl-CoA hydratase/carnithine racemase